MGVVNEVYEEKATKPRERQFQVVPVPGVFNRGRWKCWDYKDNGVGDHHQLAPEDRDIIDLSNKTDVIVVVPAEETPVDSQLVTSASASSLLPSHESSTIVVTSIAYSSPQLSHPTSDMTSDVVDDAPLGVSSMPVVTTSLIDDQQSPSQQSNYITNLSPPQQQSRQSIATPATILSRQASSQTLTASVSPPPDVVIDAITTTTTTTTASITGSASGSNVAIDNKIEQAMDLVKTHLTYAVREEVEILRSTIVDLEAKVTRLENENALLRQYAPAEVVAQLPYLIAANQQQKQAQQNTMTPNEQ